MTIKKPDHSERTFIYVNQRPIQDKKIEKVLKKSYFDKYPIGYQINVQHTLGYQINVGLCLLNFKAFSHAYALIRYPTFINFPTHAGTSLWKLCICHISMYVLTTYIFSLDKGCGCKSQSPQKMCQKEVYFYDFEKDIEKFMIFFCLLIGLLFSKF